MNISSFAKLLHKCAEPYYFPQVHDARRIVMTVRVSRVSMEAPALMVLITTLVLALQHSQDSTVTSRTMPATRNPARTVLSVYHEPTTSHSFTVNVFEVCLHR